MKISNKSLRRGALAAAVAMALVPAASFAQEATAQESPAAAEPVELETIIVTAQKRAENIREVPASVSVIGETQLEDFHATQLSDIAAYIPGFQVGSGNSPIGGGTPGQNVIALRGIAPLSGNSTVGIYIDEAPQGSSGFYASSSIFSVDLLPYDIERIEVLRGPQGTLYGASTLGGLLKYVTRKPDLDEFEIRAGAEVFDIAGAGDLGSGGRFGINVPLVEGKLALRASYSEQSTPGYIDNAVTGEEDQNDFTQQSGRVALLWQASDDVSLELTAMQQKIDADNNGSVMLDAATLEPVFDDRSNGNRFDEPYESRVSNFAATLNWGLGWADFVSATSYADSESHLVKDVSDIYGILPPALTGGLIPAGLSVFTQDFALTKLTQEFRLSSAAEGKVDWQVGAFYTEEDSGNRQHASAQALDGSSIPVFDPFFAANLVHDYTEYALFGNLTFKFNDRFDLGLGARWAHNDQDFVQINSGSLLTPGAFPNESSESVWTYSLTPRFHLSEDSMLYARVASGYRPGGPNVVITGTEPPAVEADTVVNYELGLKTAFLDNRILIDAAVFAMDWEDIQLTALSGGVFTAVNGGTARSQGVELSAVFRPTAGLQFGLNAAYTDAKLTEDTPVVTIVNGLGESGKDGDRLPGIPELSAALTADYSFPLRGDWTGHIGGGVRYVDDRLSGVESLTSTVVAKSYSVTDLNAAFSNEHWTVRLYVKNVFDKHAYLGNFTTLDALSQPAFVLATPLQPRTIGVSVDVRF